MEQERKLCGLITDFGTGDYFTGVLKGVIKTINPSMEVVDITNEIPSYSLSAASFALEQSYPFFPAGTIFLVVVDPGVGTRRRILLAESGGRYFVAPDNGVLTPVLQAEDCLVHAVEKREFFLIGGHSTFEARDKMAPVAAYLGTGVESHQMGPQINDPLLLDHYTPSLETEGKSITARIAYIDKFGNLMTNLAEDWLFSQLEASGMTRFKVIIKTEEIREFFTAYARAGKDSEPFMLIGSHGNLEIALDRASAAERLNAVPGTPLEIVFY